MHRPRILRRWRVIYWRFLDRLHPPAADLVVFDEDDPSHPFSLLLREPAYVRRSRCDGDVRWYAAHFACLVSAAERAA